MNEIEFGQWMETFNGVTESQDDGMTSDKNLAASPAKLSGKDANGNEDDSILEGGSLSSSSPPIISNTYLEMRARKIGRNWGRLASLSLIGNNEASKEIEQAWSWSAEAVLEDAPCHDKDWCDYDTMMGVGQDLDTDNATHQVASAKKSSSGTRKTKKVKRMLDNAGEVASSKKSSATNKNKKVAMTMRDNEDENAEKKIKGEFFATLPYTGTCVLCDIIYIIHIVDDDHSFNFCYITGKTKQQSNNKGKSCTIITIRRE